MQGRTSPMRRAPLSMAPTSRRDRVGKAMSSCTLPAEAAGSATEVEYHLLLCRGPESLQAADFQRLSDGVAEVKPMLASLMKTRSAER